MSDQHDDLTPADDDLHAPSEPRDPMWTETYYFSFDLPERSLSLAIYPFFRRNLNIWSLQFHLWDHTAVEPWAIPYSKFLWHLPLAKDVNLTDFNQAGLRYKTLEPLTKYLVGYHDGDRISMELEYEGLHQPFTGWTQVDKHNQSSGKGHFDQDCRVRGDLILNGERIRIDTFGHRDRSWYNRPDMGARRSASVSFGLSESEQFFVAMPRMVGTDATPEDGASGYLMRDGVRGEIISIKRHVTERYQTRPMAIEFEATDDLGRKVEAKGRAANAFAFNTSPPIFAWMCQYHWTTANGDMVGEEQEAYAYSEMAELLRNAR